MILPIFNHLDMVSFCNDGVIDVLEDKVANFANHYFFVALRTLEIVNNFHDFV